MYGHPHLLLHGGVGDLFDDSVCLAAQLGRFPCLERVTKVANSFAGGLCGLPGWKTRRNEQLILLVVELWVSINAHRVLWWYAQPFLRPVCPWRWKLPHSSLIWHRHHLWLRVLSMIHRLRQTDHPQLLQRLVVISLRRFNIWLS